MISFQPQDGACRPAKVSSTRGRLAARFRVAKTVVSISAAPLRPAGLRDAGARADVEHRDDWRSVPPDQGAQRATREAALLLLIRQSHAGKTLRIGQPPPEGQQPRAAPWQQAGEGGEHF